MIDSTENTTPSKSTKSNNSNFSVQIQIRPRSQFEFAKEPLMIGLFCGKWPIKIRHLHHPVGCLSAFTHVGLSFCKRAQLLVALLRKVTCNLRHPMHLRHPVDCLAACTHVVYTCTHVLYTCIHVLYTKHDSSAGVYNVCIQRVCTTCVHAARQSTGEIVRSTCTNVLYTQKRQPYKKRHRAFFFFVYMH